MKTFELWDVESGNLIGGFDGEAKALKVVQEPPDGNGSDDVEALDLGWEDEAGNSGSIATGAALRDHLRLLAPATGVAARGT